MDSYRIDRLGHLGDGIAAGPVFAPGALPGEEVTGRLEGDRLRDLRILRPSPDRVTPPCRHFSACGGCQMQHLRDSVLAEWKAETVRAALAAHGIEAGVRPMAVSPPASRRRATFAARRTKKGALVGFHGRASEVITEIPECRLLHPDLMAVLPAIRALAMTGASRRGALRVTATISEAGADLSVAGGRPLDGPLRADLAHLAETHDLARLVWDDEPVVTRRPPWQAFDGIRVVPPPGAFLQATREGEAALRADVAEIVGSAARVVDLFAGCGTFALPLARRAEVHAVEGATEMVAALDAGWRGATGLRRVTAEARDLFRRPLGPDALAGFDAAVIDPPRAGAQAQVGELARARLPVIAYVSCNPQSLARDAAMLVEAGYRLNWYRIVDQFRWSVHTEMVAEFRLTGV